MKDVLEDARPLELGWMTGEVIVTYIECRWYRKFGHLAHNYRNREQEKKERSTLQNRFKVLTSRVMRCGLRREVKVRKQEVVEEVQCFRYRRTGHRKWEYSNIVVEKEKRR